MDTDESENLLDRLMAAIEQQKQAVRMYFDDGDNMDGLHCCANALRGLRTSDLSPKSYYELYIKATEVLNSVNIHLTDEFQHGRSIPHLYEIVQYVSNVLPRLYLLITVGAVYIRVSELPCHEILRDLVEMCRGVQHPLRGLFLRNYLLTSISASLLPDSPLGKEADVKAGEMLTSGNSEELSVLNSVDFILLNFAEMNKLWVRMQHQGHTRERERREQERRDLRVLVGANLHRLSQLESINTALYQSHILPSILTQVIQCHDVIAQEYLMDVIVQTFPDEFHAATLPQLLQACEHLQPAVRMKPIIESLVERLLRYISEERGDSIGGGEGLFQSLSTELSQLVRRRADLYTSVPVEARLGLPLEDVPGLFAPLLTMAIFLHSSPETVDQVLLSAAAALETLAASSSRIQGGSVLSRELLSLLYLPLYGPGGPLRSVNSSLECATLSIFSSGVCPPPPNASVVNADAPGSLSVLLGFSGLLRLCALLDVPARRRFACHFIARAIERACSSDTAIDSQRITTEADLDAFLSIVGVLIDRQDPSTTSTLLSSPASSVEDTTEELSLLAAAIHLIGRRIKIREDIEGNLLLLVKMRNRLAAGGSVVVKATFPALVFKAIQLLPMIGSLKEGPDVKFKDVASRQYENVMTLCHQSAAKLIACKASVVVLRLFLNCTLMIETVVFEKRPHFAYEFFSQAFTLFEQELPDAQARFSALRLLVGTLWQARRCLDAQSAGILQTQCLKAASQVVLRTDQSRAVAFTAQLLLPSLPTITAAPGKEVEAPVVEVSEIDSEGVFERLEEARSLADMCMDVEARTQVYVDLLNYHIVYHNHGVGPFKTMKVRLAQLLTETEKLVEHMEFVPEPLSLYLEATRSKALEILNP